MRLGDILGDLAARGNVSLLVDPRVADKTNVRITANQPLVEKPASTAVSAP